MTYLARVLALPGGGFDAVFDWVIAFRKELFIPDRLADLGVQEAELETLSEKAMRDPSTGGNPVPMTIDSFRKLIRAAIRGDYALNG
jgi:hypothetical protein